MAMVFDIFEGDLGHDDIFFLISDDRKFHILVSFSNCVEGQGEGRCSLHRRSKPRSFWGGRTIQPLHQADCTNRQIFGRVERTEPYSVRIRTDAGPDTRGIEEY